MKTQTPFGKYGFTLVEIMVTISIIWVLTVAMIGFTTNPQQSLTKAERLANKIATTLQDANIFLAVGRMDNSNPPQAVTGVVLTFGMGSGVPLWEISWKYTDNFSGKLIPPYYDGDYNYMIEKIEWTGGVSPFPASGSIPSNHKLNIQITSTGSIYYTWASVSNIIDAPILTFTTKHQGFRKKVVFDRRTGRVEVNKN